MTIIARYIFRQAFGAVMLILLSLTGVVWIALALKQLNLVTAQGQDVLRLITMTTLALPNLLGLIAPIALLIATIHTLNRLNTDSELIVLTAAGATIWTVARPLLLLAAVISAGVAVVNHVGMPWSLRTLRSYILDVRTDLLTQVIQPGRFTTPEGGVMIHIRDRSLDGTLHGILMHDTRDPKQHLSYLAERGVIAKQDKSAYLTMSNGHILRRTDGGDPVQVIVFGRYAIDLDRFDQKTAGPIDLKPRERDTTDLWNPGKRTENDKYSLGHFRAEFHERFSSPLYPFVFVIFALAFVGQAQSTRQRRVQTVATAFVLAAATRLGGLGLNNLVVLKPAAAVLMYAVPLGAILLGLALMHYNARPRRTPRFIAAILETGSRWVPRLPPMPWRNRVGSGPPSRARG